MDVKKQIDYWRSGSIEDFSAAKSLLEKRHLRHALFLAHLALEKMLKAHVTRVKADLPPRIHNLLRLAELSGLPLELTHMNFLSEFNVYQMEGRYPDAAQIQMDPASAQSEIAKAEEFLKWLTAQF